MACKYSASVLLTSYHSRNCALLISAFPPAMQLASTLLCMWFAHFWLRRWCLW